MSDEILADVVVLAELFFWSGLLAGVCFVALLFWLVDAVLWHYASRRGYVSDSPSDL